MENNPNDVLGPPPSYDSVVYGSDGGSGPVHTGSDIPPPQYATSPSGYPSSHYTYPVPPSYPVNPAYPGAAATQPYPFSSQAHGTTIVCANESPQTATGVCRRRRAIIIVVIIVSFFIIVVLLWNLFKCYFLIDC